MKAQKLSRRNGACTSDKVKVLKLRTILLAGTPQDLRKKLYTAIHMLGITAVTRAAKFAQN